MKKLLAISLLVFLSSCTAISFFVVNLPAEFSDKVKQAYNDISYGKKDYQKLNVYEPTACVGDKKLPVVIFFYGGKWTAGDKDDYLFAAEAFVSKSMVTVVPDYVKYPEGKFPQFIEDGAQAIKWTHDNIDKFCGDTNRVFLVGHSAGAHLAALVAADEHYLNDIGGTTKWIRGVAGISGPYKFTPSKYELTDVFGKENFEKLKVTNYIDGKEPPYLLLQSYDDSVVGVKQGKMLEKAITAKHGKVKMIYYHGVDHRGMVAALSQLRRERAPVLDDIVRFIKNN